MRARSRTAATSISDGGGDARESFRAQADAVLRETQQFYVAVDEAGVVLAWNRAAERTFGYQPEQAIGASLAHLIIAPQHREAHRQGMQAFALTGHGRGVDAPVEVQAMRADGSEVPVHLTIWAQATPDGYLFHALGSDLTESRRHERVLRALADHRRALLHADCAEDVHAVVVEGLRHAAAGDGAWLFLFGASTQALTLAATSPGTAPRPTVVVRADEDAPDAVRRVLLEPTGIDRARAGLLVGAEPVALGGQTAGILALRVDGRECDAQGLRDLLTLFADEAGLVLERLALQEQLASAARTDSLTGLANRRAFDEALVRLLGHAQRAAESLALVLVDLDHFKAYNDTHGHPAGDDLLRRTAAAWAGEVRTPDLLARLGGDEFALVLPGATEAAAHAAVTRLASVTPQEVSLSAGIAVRAPEDDARTLMQRADTALYRTKRSRGRPSRLR